MFWQALAALLPTIGVSLLFWYVMRTILRADRTERLEMARFEAEQLGAGPPGEAEGARSPHATPH